MLTTPPPVEPNTVLVLMSVPEMMLSSNLVVLRRRAANSAAMPPSMTRRAGADRPRRRVRHEVLEERGLRRRRLGCRLGDCLGGLRRVAWPSAARSSWRAGSAALGGRRRRFRRPSAGSAALTGSAAPASAAPATFGGSATLAARRFRRLTAAATGSAAAGGGVGRRRRHGRRRGGRGAASAASRRPCPSSASRLQLRHWSALLAAPARAACRLHASSRARRCGFALRASCLLRAIASSAHRAPAAGLRRDAQLIATGGAAGPRVPAAAAPMRPAASRVLDPFDRGAAPATRSR